MFFKLRYRFTYTVTNMFPGSVAYYPFNSVLHHRLVVVLRNPFYKSMKLS